MFSRARWRLQVLSYTETMKLLAIDSATDTLCLALCLGSEVHALHVPGGPQASSRLLPAAQSLLHAHGLQWSQLEGLACGQGPGAFTGLRAASAAVQGLALGLERPAVTVCSLMVVAEAARHGAAWVEPCRLHVAVDARMGQVYARAFDWDGAQWHAAAPAAVLQPEAALSAWASEPPVAGSWGWAGSGLACMGDARFDGAAVAGAKLLESEAHTDGGHERAMALGRCAVQAWRSGPHLDAAQVMPAYVRDQVALTTQERQALALEGRR